MSRKLPWWQSQYLDPVIVDLIFGWQKNTVTEVDQILQKMKLRPGARILDLACGQGRHSIELAKRGYQLTGLDYSPFLLARAKKLAKALPQSKRPVFIEGDMRRVKRIFEASSFDAVINLWNAWGYFTKRSDDRQVLAGITHALKPGGALVINTLNEGGVINRVARQPSRWHEESPGVYFLQKFTYVEDKKKLRAQWILINTRKRDIRHTGFSQNVYSTTDFRKELRLAGLKMTHLWGMLVGSPYSKTSWHQTFVARKKFG